MLAFAPVFRYVLLLPALLLLAAGCGDGSAGSPPGEASSNTSASAGPAFKKEGTLAFVREGDTLSTLNVEVAETPKERERGLMGRTALPTGSGMLFLMEKNEPQGFWMKNTPMALDIFFANADSQIVRVAKNTTPYSTEQVKSRAPAKFVVEVPAGYADRRGIVAGDRIRFRRTAGGGGSQPDSAAAFGARPRQAEERP